VVTESIVVDTAGEASGLAKVPEPDKAGLLANEAQVLAFERRRSGRQDVSPVLVPLLRDPASQDPGLEHAILTETPFGDYLDADPFRNQLAPARGIVIGLSLSMLFWGVVGYMIFR
jgi:hypothetical protein